MLIIDNNKQELEKNPSSLNLALSGNYDISMMEHTEDLDEINRS